MTARIFREPKTLRKDFDDTTSVDLSQGLNGSASIDLHSTLKSTTSKDFTLTILGCGTMGIALLSGILNSPAPVSSPSVPPPNAAASHRRPTRFIACVRSDSAGLRILREMKSHIPRIIILQDQNAKGVAMGDVIILACKPQAVEALLSQPEILDALEGKLLISICAGVTMDQLLDIVESRGKGTKNGQEPCCIVRAMPNTAAFIGQSSTVISIPPRPLSPERATLVDWIFSRIGRVFYLPADKMDACTALCGSGPAFVAVICEAMADGAVNNGIPRKEALEMSAQVLKGAAEMILQGEHPAILKDKVCTPAGCTIAGLLELEDGRVRSTVARAVDKATLIASQLGQGTKSKTAR